MAELKKYTSFEALKLDEKPSTVYRHNDVVFSEFEAFLKNCKTNTPRKRRPKHIMESSLADNILTVCRTLNKFSLEYMIVGGTAVALHEYYRHSMNVVGEIAEKPDLDFWYNPTYHNYFKLLNALEELGQDVTKYKDE